MSSETTVKWTAADQDVPYVGHFQRNEQYTLPTAQAQQFINDGKAQLVKPRRAGTTED